MNGNDIIQSADLSSLRITFYPDARLKQDCAEVPDPADPAVGALAERMFELMFAGRGVGLAGPQVGVTARLFVASPTADTGDRRVYINPRIISSEGSQEDDEGCLSFPGIFCKIKRHASVTIRAQGLDGEWFEESGSDLHARILQHESDHLDGILLVDRMGSVARLSNRKALKALQQRYAEAGQSR
ncbi:MAG: peptide deformylase [Planctomycetota bacterium]